MNKKIFKDMGRGQKVMILQEAHNTGEPVAKVAAKYSLPDMAIIGPDGRFDYNGKRITPAEWEAINPYGEHGKLVTINTQENIDNNKLK